MYRANLLRYDRRHLINHTEMTWYASVTAGMGGRGKCYDEYGYGVFGFKARGQRRWRRR